MCNLIILQVIDLINCIYRGEGNTVANLTLTNRWNQKILIIPV